MLRNGTGIEAEASSVIALLMLDSPKGQQIEIEATGPDEAEALSAVVNLINSGFDEAELTPCLSRIKCGLNSRSQWP